MELRLGIGVLGIATACLGCDPNVEFDNTPVGNLYSVNCFISPQDTAHIVWLYRASALGEIANPDMAVERNAVVVISDGVKGDTLQIRPGEEYYQSTIKEVHIEPLKTYFLSISIIGLPEIKGTCIVPPTPLAPAINGMRVDDNFNFVIKWNNPSRHPYFVVSAAATGTYERNGPFGPTQLELRGELTQRSFPSANQLADNQAEGQVRFAFAAVEARLSARIWNIDKHFLEYYQTFDDYDAWITSAREPIPLFNQPKAIYSNVTNAVGVFAAFSTSETTIDIKALQ